MAAIVFPPHSAPRGRTRRAFPAPVGGVRPVPVSHPRPSAVAPWPTPVARPRVHVPPALGRAGVPVAVYRRRRIAVALVGVALLALASSLVVALSVRVAAATDVRPATVSAPASITGPAPTTYTVRPGDTLWSIARRLQPEGDVRPLVDQLAERNGGAALQIGQRLDLGGLELGDAGLDGLDGLGR